MRRLPKLRSLIPQEQRYEANLKLIINDLRKLFRKHIDPVLEPVTNKIEARLDDEAGDLKAAFGKIRTSFDKQYKEKDFKRTAELAASGANAVNAANNVTMMKSLLNIQPSKFEPWLNPEINVFVNSNVSLIKTLPNEAFSDIEQMLYRDSRRGLSAGELKKGIKDIFGATDKQATKIARDQVTKFNGSLTELRQTKAGIEEYTWLTSSDGRVRPDHDRLNNTVQRWDDPPITVRSGKRSGERNHPGADIICRCQAIPVIPKPRK